MKKAIVYYSMSGNTEYVAERISEKVDVDLIKIVPKKEYPNKGLKKFLWGGKSALMGDTPELIDYVFDGDRYDCIIFGSPVWAAQFTPPIRSFINENKEKLKNKKIAAFACFSGSGADNALEKLKNLLEIENFDVKLTLIDPKNRKSDEKDKEIDEFCNKLNELN